MKQITYSVLGTLLLCFLALNAQAQELVKDVKISSEKTTLQMADQSPQSYLLEIGGPDSYYWKKEIKDVKSINLSNLNAKGEKFSDGLYKLQVTPILKISPEQKAMLKEIRFDEKAMAAFRIEHNFPTEVDVYNINFSIRNGKFVTPEQKEARLAIPSISSSWNQNHPSLYASLNSVELDYGKPVMTADGQTYATDNSLNNEDDQVFADDVIVQSSICVGFDCANGESFGSDTQRLKENNLRIHFDDTSASASFPGNDWRITINDSTNGGANYFAVEDATAGRIPFRIEAGAPVNTLYVEDDGDVGIKTANPVVDLHMVEGNTPTLRLEQDGSDGFASQTWDIAGNETNFFIRDVNNGSALPFRIRAGADQNAIFIQNNNNVGLLTESPQASLHVRRTDGTASVLVEETNSSASDVLMTLSSNSSATTNMLSIKNNSTTAANRTLLVLENNGGNRIQFNNTDSNDASEYTFGLNNNGLLIMSRIGVSGTAFTVDANNNIGVKTTSPGFEFEVNGNAAKTGGGVWETASDRKLKTKIENYTDGLDKLLQIRPVRYEFNGKQGLVTDKKFIGIIAQEMQEVAPYMINQTVYTDEEGNKSNYLSYDGSALTYMLINSVKTQNEKIEKQAEEIKELQEELSKVEQLQKQVAELTKLVKQNAND